MRFSAVQQVIFYLILCAFFPLFTVDAQTNVSGLISSNTIWTLANSPYRVIGNILVNNGVTLTIEPGVTVQFDTTKTLQIDGELIAIGTALNRITFTASDSTPVRGSWGRIQFSTTATDAVFDSLGNYVSGSIFKYCDIQYGGGVTGDVTLFCDTAAPYFSHCRISENKKHVIRFVNAVGRVDSSSIRNNGGTAIEFINPVSVDLIVKNDTIENNGGGIGGGGSGSFTNILVQNCIFTRSGNTISALASSTNTLIENNTFTLNFTVINLSSPGNSVIANNVFNANKDVIQGNLGIATISNNIFTGNTQSVMGDGCCSITNFSAANFTITNNYFENNKGAIFASGTHFVIDGNIFLNNRFYSVTVNIFGSSFTDYHFVNIVSGQGIISNNSFDGNNSIGAKPLIQVEGQWEIANNVIRNNTRGLISCSGTGNICDNKFISNPGGAVTFSGTSGSFSIHHNEFFNNTGGSSTISGSNNSIINNNLFQDNSPSNSVIEISAASIISNNRFLNNLNSGAKPVISISSGNANIHNNNFLNNTGSSCLRISGSILPLIVQNNFMNPSIQYEIENLIPFTATNLNIDSNYWGGRSIAGIDSVIKDFFDDGSLSIAHYTPVLPSAAAVDTAALCFTDTAISISGAIIAEDGVPVPGATITLSGDYNLMLTTDSTGLYNFAVPKNGSYVIKPSKNNDVVIANGITGLDVLLMRRHTLGIATLGSPYKIIAAAECSAEGDSTISTLDILLTRSLVVSTTTSYPTNRLWQFVSSDYVFPDVTNPFPFPNTRTYTNIVTNQTNQNFIGIKLGDVNNSWDSTQP